MISITCALVTAAVLCMLFASTRNMGVLFVTILCFLYPIPVILVLIGVGIVFYKKRKSRTIHPFNETANRCRGK